MLKGYGTQEENKREDSFKCVPKEKEEPGKRKRGFFDRLFLQLLVSVLIIAGAFGVKSAYPEIFGKATQYVSSSVDFERAFEAISLGISGETELKQAITDACRYAFISGDDEIFAVGDVSWNETE